METKEMVFELMKLFWATKNEQLHDMIVKGIHGLMKGEME